jgi:hypothetical protein
LKEKYAPQIITPSLELTTSITNSISTNIIYEQAIFRSDLYRRLFEYIDFNIGDQTVEQLNKDVMEIQYQFLKDPQKRNQIDKIVKTYDNGNNGIRLIVPLEFWFNADTTKYLPLVCLTYTLISLRFKISDINSLILNTDYILTNNNVPDINIQLNIDGILLDTIERDLFGNTSHEYLIEKFKTYPDTLISQVVDVARMKFKNMIKDIFIITEIVSNKENTYLEYKTVQDKWLIDFEKKYKLYQQFLLIGVYTTAIPSSNATDFDYIKQAINDINTNAERYVFFNSSKILSKYNMIYTLYLDSKYQQKLTTLLSRIGNLEVYYSKIYMNTQIIKNISPITTMSIQSAGRDLFVPLDNTYFNQVVPYERYKTSVNDGYYAYSFSLYPTESQPSGHCNFNMLDDVVINLTNSKYVNSNPFYMKTTVREYNIIRIMSGMGALAFMD